MKSEHENASDIPLRRVLHQWQVKDPLPPGFGDRVWQRIERAETGKRGNKWGSYLEQFLVGLRRPAVAGGYIAVLVLIGLGAGHWQSTVDNANTLRELGVRYVQMMDPYQRLEH